MKYAAYNEYKSSGSNWLDSVPSHWNVKPLKLIVKMPITDGPHETPEFIPDGVPFASVEAVWDGKVHLSSVRGYISEYDHRQYGKKYHPKKDDILIVKSGSTTGKIAIVDFDDDFNVWSPLAAVRCDVSQACPEFVFYALSSSYFQRLVKVSWSFGTQPNIGMGVLGNLPAVLPPLLEQQAIARFLDAKTTQIDTLVAQKRQLIAKLKEKRSALIARTVTRGLPPEAAKAAGLEPNPEMKDSGVDWLGEIPAHWEATQLKRTWAICEYGISESLSGEGDIRVLTMGNIQDGRVTLPSAGCLENILENMLLNDGDLLFNRTNSLAHVGKVGLYRPDGKGPVSFASYLVRIRPNSRTIPEFMTYLLNIPQLLSFARGLALPSINQANLNPTRYGQIHVALPPIQEQHMIVEYVDRVASKVDRLTSEVEIAVNRLTEYRQALITSAVTGKIDVRGWQAELEAA